MHTPDPKDRDRWLNPAPIGLVASLAWHVRLAVCLLTAGALLTPKFAAAEGPVVSPDLTRDLDPYQMAQRIDELLASYWQAGSVQPSPPADDAEFMRRVYLDIVGKIPSASEALEFLDDTRPDKRRLLVDELLNRAAYASHFANAWREMMLPSANTNPETRGLVPPFESWLRLRFAENVPYDQLAIEVLTAAVRDGGQNPLNPGATSRLGPDAFYQVNEQKPENLAANVTRVFLGVQVQCAQCHDHPHSHWKRTEFWSLAAFFSDGTMAADQQNDADAAQTATTEAAAETPADAKPGASEQPVPGRSILIPELNTLVQATFPDGTLPNWNADSNGRVALARWTTSLDNPYFAKAAINRLWHHFFGRGLVDPVDDIDAANAPSHPEVFELLSRQFAYHHFDFKYAIRAITSTRAYQLSSQTTHPSQDIAQHFARPAVRHMTADQFFDSLLQATGFRERARPQQPLDIFGQDSVRSAFQARFNRQVNRLTEPQTSILQALSLMNGEFVANATSLDRSEALTAIAEAPFLDTPARVDMLFLATLSRHPQSDELNQFSEYVNRAGNESDSKQALSDVFWALLNSAEFSLNH